MMPTRSLKLFLTLGLVVIAPSLLVHPAHAGTGTSTASSACDPNFRKSLEYRGWQELQREVQANQKTILKPDSVFALSCFGEAVQRVPQIFTQNANTNTNAVRTSMTNYASNFNHGYLTNGNGGSQQLMGTTCGQMQTLWNSAQVRCLNMDPAVFSTMKVGDESRSGMSCGAASWATASGHLGGIGGQPYTDGTTFDGVKLFLGVTDPLSMLTGSNNKCSKGVPTGVKIGAGGSDSYDEVVCGNPGCVPFIKGTGSNTKAQCCDQTDKNGNTKCQDP